MSALQVWMISVTCTLTVLKWRSSCPAINFLTPASFPLSGRTTESRCSFTWSRSGCCLILYTSSFLTIYVFKSFSLLWLVLSFLVFFAIVSVLWKKRKKRKRYFTKKKTTSVNKFFDVQFQVHRGIKGVVRDKDTEAGIADAIIKVDDIDHHIRSGTVLCHLWQSVYCYILILAVFSSKEMLNYVELSTKASTFCWCKPINCQLKDGKVRNIL